MQQSLQSTHRLVCGFAVQTNANEFCGLNCVEEGFLMITVSTATHSVIWCTIL